MQRVKDALYVHNEKSLSDRAASQNTVTSDCASDPDGCESESEDRKSKYRTNIFVMIDGSADFW